MIVMLEANYVSTVEGTAFSFEWSSKAIVPAVHSTLWGGATGSVARDVRGDITVADSSAASQRTDSSPGAELDDAAAVALGGAAFGQGCELLHGFALGGFA